MEQKHTIPSHLQLVPPARSTWSSDSSVVVGLLGSGLIEPVSDQPANFLQKPRYGVMSRPSQTNLVHLRQTQCARTRGKLMCPDYAVARTMGQGKIFPTHTR